MRKLVWFIIIVLLILTGVSVACAYSPTVKDTVVGGLTGIGGLVWVSISNGWTNLASIAGANGTNFLISTCVTALLSIGLFLVLTRSRVVAKLPGIKKTETVSEGGYQTAPPAQPLPIPKKSSSTVEPQPVAEAEMEVEPVA